MTAESERQTAAESEWFGTLPDGAPVRVFTLSNGTVQMRVLDYGGIVTQLRTPDRHGASGDIVLGHDQLHGYVEQSPYFGALIGRYANRIANAEFMLDGHRHALARNDGPNALHGGTRGFDKVKWTVQDASRMHLALRYVSADGEEGYPGTLDVRVRYSVTADDRWVIEYEATTDAPTPVNLTQHSYWNLRADASRDILGHELSLFADHFTPVNATLIPTGRIQSVTDTPFDFRAPTRIGARIDAPDVQLEYGQGYDHNWVLGGAIRDGGMRHAAHVREPESGRTLDVYTTEPGVQFYSGNVLDGTIRGKSATVYGPRHGFCLETQHFPDSPNQPAFPDTILRPGQFMRSRTEYAFGVHG